LNGGPKAEGQSTNGHAPRNGTHSAAFSTRIKQGLNSILFPFGLKLETLRADQQEQQRLKSLNQGGHFQRQVFPVPNCIRESQWPTVIGTLEKYRTELARLQAAGTNDVGFTDTNTYYHSPDSEVLYAFVREHRPSRIVEIGSGHSTQLMRQAIWDGRLATIIVSIDPSPRTDIQRFVDESRPQRVESIPAAELAAELQPGDFLFIDSSHIAGIGNDCVYEFLQLLPLLKPGVFVHVHDVFLPWDYPWEWIQEEPQMAIWTEQYLLQAILMSGTDFEVLWPGYYVQQTSGAEFDTFFSHRAGRDAASFWMRRR